jgi:hypothetical protein
MKMKEVLNGCCAKLFLVQRDIAGMPVRSSFASAPAPAPRSVLNSERSSTAVTASAAFFSASARTLIVF